MKTFSSPSAWGFERESIPEPPSGRMNGPDPMRRLVFNRNRLAAYCVAACLLAVPILGVVRDVHAQPAGPEIFGGELKTPLDLWDAVDYLVRTGQVKQALPYLDKFLKSQPDDETLLKIRDRYGAGSILHLDDHPETRAAAKTLTDMLTSAIRRNATRAERIEPFIALLTQSTAEQQYAVEQLRTSGPYAVPRIVKALERPDLTPENHALIVRNLGKLDGTAVPALLAVLDSPNSRLVADAADALGRIGDARAIPPLMALAGAAEPSHVRTLAREAIARLTGRSFESQPKSPVRLLVDEARRYHRHQIRFPGETVLVWTWDAAQAIPVPQEVPVTDAEAYFGMRLARAALRLDPADVPAQVVFVSLTLEKAIERAGVAGFPGNDSSGAFAAALAAGPNVLGAVLRTAISDGKMELAAAAATALGQVTDRDALSADRRPNPLVAALSAPDRRVQFASARALVLLDPRRAFAGSSQVVPVLARFVVNQAAPRAVVIDGNSTRGGQLVGFLRTLGYDPTLAATGDEGFRVAADSADVELILIDVHLIAGDWRLVDTLSNLKADARTAGIPIYVVGPLGFQVQLDATFQNYPGVKYLVTPMNADLLSQQIGGRPVSLSDEERASYARDAAALLAVIASRTGSPFEPDLNRSEPALAIALYTPPTSLAASSALGDVPDAGAQRSLADVLLDPSKPAPLRLSTAAQLARSIQRFGPLVTGDQEAKLIAALDQEGDLSLRTALAGVVGALRPKPALTGQRLQLYRPLPASASPAQAEPAPGAAPSPPAPDTAPPAAAEAVPPPANAKP
jgi:CheY-like chemotaxis protein